MGKSKALCKILYLQSFWDPPNHKLHQLTDFGGRRRSLALPPNVDSIGISTLIRSFIPRTNRDDSVQCQNLLQTVLSNPPEALHQSMHRPDRLM